MTWGPSTFRRARAARVLAWVIVSVVMLGLGGGVGFWAASRLSVGTAPEQSSADSEQLYTCGMHPNVIQKGPGECPICHMKLTPLRAGDDGGGSSPTGPKERKVLYWRAPMDPSYISEKPGKSPMGMDLVPVYADETESATGKTITIDPVTIQNMGVRTAELTRGPLVKTIRTVGRVDYDEQTLFFINTKFEGWIEKLHVDQTGVQVEKGDPLFEVYSPALYSAQEEFLAALRGVERLNENTIPEFREQSRQLVDAARIRLKYYDVSDDQVEQLARSREIQKTLTIHSPARGIVTEKMAQEGMYLTPGMRLYAIADLAKVWVYVDVYEYQLPWVRIGQEARMSLPYVPNRDFVGRVTYVYPYLDKQTRVIKLRLEFENPTLELKPAMYANVTLRADLDRNALLIPREAFIDSGTRKVAFVALAGGKFQPRDIQTGVEAEDGLVEVQYGLDEGDRIVTSGQFLLDAESKLKEAIAKMLESQSSSPASDPQGNNRPAEAEKPMPTGHVH
ncbi:MAG: efflux RND transporter periplasmic adaptor subunit [Phycisphaerales bacterium]|nr:efflux RND transporter periplasmic adaptor subunit [Phycisphaerales bacterium]